MSKCQECGSDCNERDELTKAEREIERLQARLGVDRKFADQYVQQLIMVAFYGVESLKSGD